jgi:hypothetical protein
MKPKLVVAFQKATTEHFGAVAKSLGLELRAIKPDVYELLSPTCRVVVMCGVGHRTDFIVTVEPRSRALLLAEEPHKFGLGVIARYYGESLGSTLPFERVIEAQDVHTEIQMLAARTGTLCHRFLTGDMSDWQPLEAWFNKQPRAA